MFKGPDQPIEVIFTAPSSAVCGVTMDTNGKKEYLISGRVCEIQWCAVFCEGEYIISGCLTRNPNHRVLLVPEWQQSTVGHPELVFGG